MFHKLARNAFVRQMRRSACWELLPIPSNIRFSSADLRPAHGAEYFSANSRNKKEGHPTGCDSDEMPLGTEVSLLLFLLFLSLWFPHLFQDSGTARYHILKLADVQSARLKMVTRTLLWKWSTESLLISIVPYQKFFRLIVM